MKPKRGDRVRFFIKDIEYFGRLMAIGPHGFKWERVRYQDGLGKWHTVHLFPGSCKLAPERPKANVSYSRTYCYKAIPKSPLCLRCERLRRGKGRACYQPCKLSKADRLKLKGARRGGTIARQRKIMEWMEFKDPDRFEKLFEKSKKDKT